MWGGGCNFPFVSHGPVDTATISSNLQGHQSPTQTSGPRAASSALRKYSSGKQAQSLLKSVQRINVTELWNPLRPSTHPRIAQPPLIIACFSRHFPTSSIPMNLCYLLFASSLEHEVSEGRNFHCSCLCFSGA